MPFPSDKTVSGIISPLYPCVAMMPMSVSPTMPTEPAAAPVCLIAQSSVMPITRFTSSAVFNSLHHLQFFDAGGESLVGHREQARILDGDGGLAGEGGQ